MFPTASDNTITLLNVSLGIWAAGGITAAIAGGKTNSRVMSVFMITGCITLLACLIACWPRVAQFEAMAPIYLGVAPLAGRIDPLASIFLALLGIIGGAAALFSPHYLDHLRGRFHSGAYWLCVFLFMISMAGVILSANAITFLVFWEIMALSSVALVATEHVRHRAQKAAFIYLGATRVSTAFLVGAFLWLHYVFQSWNFADWDFSSGRALGPAFLLFIGLAIKAGIWPFHLWLPYAHPEAPAPVSALMSAVMVKIAIYAMIRTLVFGGCHSLELGYLALFLGLVSGIWGVLFALVEKDLKRLLAYSTVENVGLIVAAIALTIMCRNANLPLLTGVALLAALFHTINHACFKGLLFLSSGAVDSSARSRDMGFLGGLARVMPWTMACFFIGSIAICCLPPLNGFASKWFIYQSLFRLAFSAPSVIDRGISLALVGVLSFIGALSLACFTKAVGITFLGKPRSESASHATEVSPAMVAAQVLLAAGCIGLGLFAAQVLTLLNPVFAAVREVPATINGIFTIPLSAIAAGLLTIGAAAYFCLLSSKKHPVRKYHTWDCGYGELPARAEETGTSFSQPIARIFSPLFQYKMFTEIRGKDRRHFPEWINMELVTLSILEERVYRPSLAILQAVSLGLVKFQTGSIHIHLMYVFLTLLILLVVGVSL
jgi:hydrogenase-4 component B